MKVKVCTWEKCSSKFSKYILERLKRDKKFYDLKSLEIEECSCLWECKKWPKIIIDWKIEEYMTPAKASEIVVWKCKNNNSKNK